MTRAIVYIDGFNLFYGLLQHKPNRWLDLVKFADAIVGPHYDVLMVKNGIISSMKGHAKSAFALTLAIAGGLASPLRSDAALDPTTAQNGVASNEARAEVRGCVVRVAGGRRGSSSNGADRITTTVEQECHNGLTLAPTVYITPTEDSLRFRKCGNVIGRPWYGKDSPHCRYRKALDG